LPLGLFRIAHYLLTIDRGKLLYIFGADRMRDLTIRKTLSKPRPPERDYSHRSLLDKLGVRQGQRILILGVDKGAFINDIQPFNPEFEERKPAGDIDLIFFGAEQKKDLARLASLRKAILKNGGIWVVYPKGRQEIREIDVIKAGKAAGLTDNKVCSFSPTHTALRFVIPLTNR
jgi:hypothetical protein